MLLHAIKIASHNNRVTGQIPVAHSMAQSHSLATDNPLECLNANVAAADAAAVIVADIIYKRTANGVRVCALRAYELHASTFLNFWTHRESAQNKRMIVGLIKIRRNFTPKNAIAACVSYKWLPVNE